MGVCWQTTGESSSKSKNSNNRLTDGVIFASQINNNTRNNHQNNSEANNQKKEEKINKIEKADLAYFDASYEESVKWIEDNKFRIAHRFTVDDLNYLKRGGRVSNSAALVGTLLNIKPVLYVPNEGTLLVSSKVRGRKKALNTIIDSIINEIGKPDDVEFLINHADCEEDAEYVKSKLLEKFPSIKSFAIQGLGVVIGAHCGPGLLAIFYMCKERTP